MAGLALATALWSGVQAINAEARASYDRAAATLGQDQLAQLSRADGEPIPLAEYVALRRAGYLVSPVLSGVLRDDGTRLRILGIDPLTAPPQAQTPGTQTGFDPSVFFGSPGVLLINPQTQGGDLPSNLPPIEGSNSVPIGAALTDIATAARLLQQEDPSYLLVHPEQPEGLAPLAEATALRLSQPEQGNDISRLTDSFHLNLTAFGLLAFAVGLFIVHSTIGLAFEQRRSTVRTLRAMGVPLRTILAATSLELAVLSLFAAGIGLVAGYFIAAALMPGVAGTLRGLYGADVTGALRFDPLWALAGLGMTLAGTAAAATAAMVRLAKMPLLASAQPRAWAHASTRATRSQSIAALILLGIALLLALSGSGLVLAFTALACLLVGAALLLPAVLELFLSAAMRLGKTQLIEWIFADTRQQLPGLSLALMALLLALAANIGVSTMVGSFRSTFIGWLDQRLAAEIYVNTSSAEEAAALEVFLRPRVDATLPIVSAEARLMGQSGEVFGMADHDTFRDNWPLLEQLPNTWDLLAAGGGVLINEQLARRSDLLLNSLLETDFGSNLTVLGVYSDYGNPLPQAIVGYDLFQSSFPDIPTTRFALRVSNTAVPDVISDMRTEFGLPTEAVVNQAEIKRFSLQVFEQTFLITGALNILTLGVAGFALLTSFVTLSSMRLPQLAPVWAIGVTRSQLAQFEIIRSLILAGLTFVIALPVGLLLAWVLLAVVNVEAFGWRLPMQVFPGDWAGLFALSLFAGGLAAAWPARRLAKIPPADLLKVFAHER